MTSRSLHASLALSLLLTAAAGAAMAAPALPDAMPIAFGDSIKGVLTESDLAWDDGSHFDRYRFHAVAGQKIKVLMTTPLLDAYLTLQKSGSTGFLASDDDGADTPLDSLLTYTITETGDYDLRASGVKKSDTGDYTLALSLEGGPPAQTAGGGGAKPTASASTSSSPAPAATPTPAPATSSTSSSTQKAAREVDTVDIKVGDTVSGTLAQNDQKDDQGYFFDAYGIRGAKGGSRWVVSAKSKDFDTYLAIHHDGELLVDNDDVGAGLNSRISLTLPDDGDYLFEITAHGADGRKTGAYTLSLKADTSPAPFKLADEDNAMDLMFRGFMSPPKALIKTPARYGQTLQGSLTSSDPIDDTSGDNSDYHFDAYTFEGRKGDKVQINLDSSAFDPELSLYDIDAVYLDSDDDGGAGANSQITAILDQDGVYRVDVGSSKRSATGAYSLTVKKL